MKRIALFTSLTIVALFSLMTYFSSCKPDSCVTRNVVCKNNGVCREGDCLCSAGYEGDSCQFRVNEKFASNYACIRTRLINETQVDDNDDTLRVKTKNDKFGITFFSIRDSIVEVLDGTANGNYITVPEKTILDRKYWGNGSLNNGVLTITLYSTWPPANTSKTTYVGYKF
jgi:hypothetical protein